MAAQVKSVVRWINENESLSTLRAVHGTVENYAIIVWFMPPAVAAVIHDLFESESD